MAPPPAYLRQPALQGDTVVFVSDDDLWRVSTAGGTAQRLTAALSEPATPCLSPCGRWLAYTGRDEQHSEVWSFAEPENKRKAGEGIVSMRRRKTAQRAELKAKKDEENKKR